MNKHLILVLSLFYNFAISQDQVRYRRCLEGCTESATNDPLNGTFSYGLITSWEEFGSIDVTSDFGMRRVAGGSKFHPGIDFSSEEFGYENEDRGDALLAIVDGTIGKIKVLPGNDRYISVNGNNGHHYCFYHIFNHIVDLSTPEAYLKSGKFVLKRTKQNSAHWVIINLENCSVYSMPETINNNYTVELTGLSPNICPNTIFNNLSSSISQGDEIAPLGNSATDKVHLHLYRFKNTAGNYNTSPITTNNIGNPLLFVNHDQPSYSISTQTYDNSLNQINLIYPGTQATKLKVRTTMNNAILDDERFTNVVLNIEKVYVGIKHQFASYPLTIEGRTHEAKICLGGRNDSNIYPESILNAYGSWNQQGIDPFAYLENGNNQPYDDYYFTDFVSRVHSTDPNLTTYIPAQCKYRDGNYTMHTVCNSIRNINYSVQNSFQIDNWMPYIENLEIFWGDTKIYDAKWDLKLFDCIGFNKSIIEAQLNFITIQNPLRIRVHCSEPMASIFLSIPEWGIINKVGTLYNPTESSFRYDFNLPSNSVTNIGTWVNFQFWGIDYSAHSLIAFSSNHESGCYNLPFKESNTIFYNPDMLPVGLDVIHKLYFANCNETNPPHPAVRFTNSLLIESFLTPAFSSSESCMDGSINISITNGVPPYVVQWFENNEPLGPPINSLGNDGYEDLNNVSSGNYTVKITDMFCSSVEQSFNIGVLPNPITLKSFENNTICSNLPIDPDIYRASGDGEIHIGIDYPLPYTLQWSGQSINGSNSSSLDLLMLCPDLYVATITNANGCHREIEINICCCTEDDPIRSANCILDGDIPVCFEENNSSIVIKEGNWSPSGSTPCNGFINPEILGGGPLLMFNWTRNGEPYSSNSKNINNLCEGQYCLTTTDGCSSTTFCWEIVNCTSNPLLIVADKHNCCDILNNGYVDLSVSGGQPSYTFNWNNNSTTEDINNLTGGIYCVTITDANKCTSSDCINILTLPAQIEEIDPCTTLYTCFSEMNYVTEEPFQILTFHGTYESFNDQTYLVVDQIDEKLICNNEIFSFNTYTVNTVPSGISGNHCFLNISIGFGEFLELYLVPSEMFYDYDEFSDQCMKKCAYLTDAGEFWPSYTGTKIAFVYEWQYESSQTEYTCLELNGPCQVVKTCFGDPIEEPSLQDCSVCDYNHVHCCAAITSEYYNHENYSDTLISNHNGSILDSLNINNNLNSDFSYNNSLTNIHTDYSNTISKYIFGYPNPLTHNFEIISKRTFNGHYSINIFNSLLQNVYIANQEVNNSNKILVDNINLPNGIYYLNLSYNGMCIYLEKICIIE